MYYLLIKQGGVPRLALPRDNVARQLEGLQYFQVFTPRARLWRAVLQAVIRLRVARWVFPVTRVDKLPLPWDSFQFSKKILASQKEFIFQFPKMPHRRKYSILAHTPKGRRYLKIGFDQKSERELSREYQISRWMAGTAFRSFSFPKLLHQYRVHSALINEFECLPPGCTSSTSWLPIHEHIWRELSSCERRQVPAQNTEWFEALSQKAPADLLDRIRTQTLRFSFVHGDFTPWNVLFAGQQTYLIDFEEAWIEAPYLFDPLHYWLVSSELGNRNLAQAFHTILLQCARLHGQADYLVHVLAALLHERFLIQVIDPAQVDELIRQVIQQMEQPAPEFQVAL